jgi:hypothetical protein
MGFKMTAHVHYEARPWSQLITSFSNVCMRVKSGSKSTDGAAGGTSSHHRRTGYLTGGSGHTRQLSRSGGLLLIVGAPNLLVSLATTE